MKRILHILTRTDDPLAESVLQQQKQPSVEIQTYDLTKRQPDYDALLKKIFEADSVQVW